MLNICTLYQATKSLLIFKWSGYASLVSLKYYKTIQIGVYIIMHICKY